MCQNPSKTETICTFFHVFGKLNTDKKYARGKKIKRKSLRKKILFSTELVLTRNSRVSITHQRRNTLFFPFDSVSLLIKRKRVETSNEKNKKGNAVVRSYGGKTCSLNFNRLFLSLPGSFFC